MFWIFTLVALPNPVTSFQSFQSNIPNGALIKVDSLAWPGIGHDNPSGAGPRNAFGTDFAAAGNQWTAALCKTDSDGDGLTNGQELGDPDCVWTKGATPQFDTGLTHPGVASAEEVNREIDSCTTYIPPSPTETTSVHVNLTFTPFQVPKKRTTYAKFAFNLADYMTSKTMYGVRFGILNKHSAVVHHAILYGCDKKPSATIVQQPSETGKMNCESVRYAWAVGGKDFCLPNTAELSVGIEFVKEKPWHVLEIHYDNPTLISLVDTSGVSIVLAQKKTGHGAFTPAGFLWAGVGLDQLSIPPGKKSYHVNAKCTYPNIPTEGISVFAYINHAHLLGRKLWTSLERNNKYAHDLGCDAQYDFDLQQIIPFEQHVKLFKSDRLYANCVYDSTGRTEVTEGGDETMNEMCINFLVYYPEVKNMRRCLVRPRIIASTSNAENKRCCSGAARQNTTGIACSGSVYGAGNAGATILPTWLIVHVVCMVVAWLLLLPSGILVATMFRKVLPNGKWFKWHKNINMVGLGVAFAGASTAMASIPDHMQSPHAILGIVVLVFALLQPVNAAMRPSHDAATTGRRVWEMVHKTVGRLSPLLAYVNIILGAIVLKQTYAGNPWPVYICVVVFSVAMVVLGLYRIWKGPFGGTGRHHDLKSPAVTVAVEMS